MPEKSNVLLWVVTDRVVEGTDTIFRDQYMIAREAAGYSHADQVADLATKCSQEGIDPNSARVAMTGYIWAAERMAPKKHSPKQELSHTSPDGSMTPRGGIDPSKLSTAALEEIMKQADESDPTD